MSNKQNEMISPLPWGLRTGATPIGDSGEYMNWAYIYDSENNAIGAMDDCEEQKDNANRIISCVNAMEGVKDPEGWVKGMREDIKDLETDNKFLDDENKYLKQYKTACEWINPDNPMAVVENLKETISFITTLSKSNTDHIPEWLILQFQELLTKIQEGKQ